MHTIAIEFDMTAEEFALREVNDAGEKGEVIQWHPHFADAQQHACMLLSETGDVRISIRPQPGANDA